MLNSEGVIYVRKNDSNVCQVKHAACSLEIKGKSDTRRDKVREFGFLQFCYGTLYTQSPIVCHIQSVRLCEISSHPLLIISVVSYGPI